MRILNVLKITIGIMLLSGNAASAQDGDPAETEVWAPEPAVVTPGDNGGPPSDAIVLFDGGSLEAWEHPDGSDVTWTVENGAMTVKANPEWEPDMLTITCRAGRIEEARLCLSKSLHPVPCGRDVVRDCTLRDALLDPVR